MTTLASIERPLALFAQGISAKMSLFQAVDRPAFSFSTENLLELRLPNTIDFYASDRENAETYRWQVLQQLAFHRYETFSFKIETARATIEYLANKPMPLMHRAPDLEQLYHHFPSRSVSKRLFYVIEEARVRHLLVAEFPGAQRLFHRYTRSKRTRSEASSDFVHETLANLELALLDDTLDTSLERLLGPITQRSTTVYTSVQVMVDCYCALFADLKKESAAINTAVHSDDTLDLGLTQRAIRLEEMQAELHDMDANLIALELSEDATASPNSESTDGSIRELDISLTRERDQLRRVVEMEKSALRQYGKANQLQGPHFRYDEWDYINQSWRKQWCAVYEIRDNEPAAKSASDVLERVRAFIPSVRRRFEQIRPSGLERIRRSIDGHELDLDAIVEARTDVKVGHPPSERIYSRFVKAQRDVSACFLVDLSASTDDPVEKPELQAIPEDREDPFDDPFLHGVNFDPDQAERPTPRKIIDVLKESVLLLATALEDLGDVYSVYGFSGYGRECVEMYIAKGFQESLGERAIQAIDAMRPLRSTRMGPAIRHATRRLLETGNSLKVLMVISDGFPQDCDYGPDRSNHEYGIQDSAKAIQEAGDKGIQVFCVTIDVSGHDYLKRMCRDDQYLVIEETHELPDALQLVYRQLTV